MPIKPEKINEIIADTIVNVLTPASSRSGNSGVDASGEAYSPGSPLGPTSFTSSFGIAMMSGIDDPQELALLSAIVREHYDDFYPEYKKLFDYVNGKSNIKNKFGAKANDSYLIGLIKNFMTSIRVMVYDWSNKVEDGPLKEKLSAVAEKLTVQNIESTSREYAPKILDLKLQTVEESIQESVTKASEHAEKSKKLAEEALTLKDSVAEDKRERAQEAAKLVELAAKEAKLQAEKAAKAAEEFLKAQEAKDLEKAEAAMQAAGEALFKGKESKEKAKKAKKSLDEVVISEEPSRERADSHVSLQSRGFPNISEDILSEAEALGSLIKQPRSKSDDKTTLPQEGRSRSRVGRGRSQLF